MMLRLQTERMQGSYVPSIREYFHFFGLDYDKLERGQARRADHASRADEPRRRDRLAKSPTTSTAASIREQVEMGVAVRMACLERWPAPAGDAALPAMTPKRTAGAISQRPAARSGDRPATAGGC